MLCHPPGFFLISALNSKNQTSPRYQAAQLLRDILSAGTAMHGTQTQQLFCHLEFVISTPDGNGWLCTVGPVCAFIKCHRVSSKLQVFFYNCS